LERITGYKALGIEGTLKCVHFYDNQYAAAKELLTRDPEEHSSCDIAIKNKLASDNIDETFNGFEISDFKLVGYTSDKGIKVDMLAPKEV